MKAIITRTQSGFSVVTDVFLSDLTYRRDDHMILSGNTLCTDKAVKRLWVGFPFTISLSPAPLATVQSLAVGQSVTLG